MILRIRLLGGWQEGFDIDEGWETFQDIDVNTHSSLTSTLSYIY